MRQYIVKLRNRLAGEQDIRKLIKMGLKIGKGVHIGGGTIIDPDHCWLITIGDYCTFAPRVHIIAHDASTKKHLNYTKIGRVTIGNRTFIGAGTIILPGVTIGDNVIIGAGSVVTRDINDNCLAMGNPAVVVDSSINYIERHRQNMKVRPVYSSEWTIGNPKFSEDMKAKQFSSLEDGIGYVE